MKLGYIVLLCALASVVSGQQETDRWDVSKCHHIEEIGPVVGDDTDCPKDGRDAAVKKALDCRCETAAGADCANIAAAKKCLCSNRRMTANGVAFTADDKVRTCPAEPAERDCPEVKECWAKDFFTIGLGSPMTFELSDKFAASLDKLPDSLKTRLTNEVLKLEFLKDKLNDDLTPEDYVKAMNVIRKLTGYTQRVAQFFKDANGCAPCKIPLCFSSLEVLKECPTGATPYTGGKNGIFEAALGGRSLCPDCRPVPAKAICETRSKECLDGQDADTDLASGCPECHKKPEPRCPIASQKAIKDCAAGKEPEKNPLTGCWSCSKIPQCATNKRQKDTDLRMCRFGEEPLVDGCTYTCRKPTLAEINAACTPEAVKKCNANYENLRECAADEVQEKDYVRCCYSCRRKEKPAGKVCTAADVEACKARTKPCPVNEQDVVCTTADQKKSAACKAHPIGGKHCCKPCYRIDTVNKPIDVAACEAKLKPCEAGESPRRVAMSKCKSCKEVNPCHVAKCPKGCSVFFNNRTGVNEAHCDEREVVMGLDIEAGRGLELETAKFLLEMFIKLPKDEIKTLIQSTVRRFCDTTDADRLTKCMGAGLKVIQSITPLQIRLEYAGFKLILGGANGATVEQVKQLLPADMTAEQFKQIICRVTVAFSLDNKAATGTGRRLLAAEDADAISIVVDSMNDAGAGGGINAKQAEADDVPSRNGGDNEIEGNAGVAVAPSLALVMAMLLMLWN